MSPRFFLWLVGQGVKTSPSHGENRSSILLQAAFEVWLSLVERCVRDAEVASSNLVASIVTRSVGQAVKTPPSHGGNRGSIPLRTARKERRKLFFFISGTGTENRPDHIYHAPPAQICSGIEVVKTGLTRNHSGPRPFRPPKTVEISRFFDGSNL